MKYLKVIINPERPPLPQPPSPQPSIRKLNIDPRGLQKLFYWECYQLLIIPHQYIILNAGFFFHQIVCQAQTKPPGF